MNINPSIFKTYDIRGVYGTDFDDSFAYKLGLAYCQLRREELGRSRMTLAVGRDMRLSSPSLHRELMRGLLDGGADVIDLGLVGTPTFYFAVAHYGYDGGIQVSASHNPKEYNGFKLVRNLAAPMAEDSGIQDLKHLLLENELTPHTEKGSIGENVQVIEEQVRYDLSLCPAPRMPMKLVIDTANGMGALYFDELLKHLPQIQVEKMNWQLDGTFPGHEADPFKPENVAALCERVRASGADLGVASDGDADRIFFVDEKGQPLSPGITRAIMAKLFLEEKPVATIAYDIRPGRITYDTIVANGGSPLVTKVGHSLIKQAMIDSGAYFAGESSGHFILNMEREGCYEVPGIVFLKLLGALSADGLKLSELARSYERYYSSGEISMPVKNTAACLQSLKEIYADGKQNLLDGLSVEYPRYWFNVRASNTEALLRINIEGVEKSVVEEIAEKITREIQSADNAAV